MVGTAQAVFFIAPEPERNAAMGAEFVHHAYSSLRVAECDQSLRHQLEANRGTIRLGQLLRMECRSPVAPEQIANGRSRAGPGQEIVLRAWSLRASLSIGSGV